jgi:hypothetical protein
MRLIDYFKILEPHQVTSSLNLYATRTCIVKLAEPMASISQAIKSSIAVNMEDMSDLQTRHVKKEILEKALKEKVVVINVSSVKPITTCHHKDCISHAGTGSVGRDKKSVTKTVYNSICHSPCNLTGVKVDNIGNAKLSGCMAMSGGICKVGGHSWKIHLHIDYEYIEETVEQDDPDVVWELS